MPYLHEEEINLQIEQLKLTKLIFSHPSLAHPLVGINILLDYKIFFKNSTLIDLEA